MGVWIETLRLFNKNNLVESHPVWVCGLKRKITVSLHRDLEVTPCMGVWIETFNFLVKRIFEKSHPVWVCGLKRLCH